LAALRGRRLVLVAVAATLGGCGGASASSLTFGYSPPTLGVPALEQNVHRLQAMGRRQGFRLLVSDPEADPVRQLQQTMGWVRRRQVRAAWIIPVSAAPMEQVLRAAQSAHVPVVAVGRPTDYGYRGPAAGVSFASVDYARYGELVGRLAAECIARRLGGAGQVVLLTDAATVTRANLTIASAFKRGLAAASPRTRILAELDSHGDRLRSKQAAASALQAHPGANVLVGFNNESTLGGLSAFQQAGKAPGSTCVIGAGADAEAKAAVRAGRVYAEATIDYARDLAELVALMKRMAAHPTARGVVRTTPIGTYRG
jgi:ABC-type sugar transport system substrate-binding protein